MAKKNDYEMELPEGDEDDGEEGLDLEKIKEILGFFLRAPRRHKKLSVTSFLLVAVAAVGAAALMPRTYETDVRILAQKPQILDDPTRPFNNDNPTKNVVDLILQRDNIVALVKQVNLVDRWDAARPPALRIKDKLVTMMSGPMNEETKMHTLVGMLEHRLFVTSDDSSITITVDWSSPDLAYELTTLVQKNFFQARYDSDVASINEGIAILEKRSKDEVANVDAALAELIKLEDAKKAAYTPPPPTPTPAGGPTTVVVRRAPTPAPTAASAEGNSDAKDLEDVRHQITQIEADQKRRLQDAQNQLADAQATLGPLHPTVVTLKQKIEGLSATPSELTALQQQERTLVARLAAANTAAQQNGGQPPQQQTPQQMVIQQRPSAPNAPPTPAPMLSLQDDGPTTLARAKLYAATGKYNELLGRIDALKIKLDVAQAAFKYKYSVVRPPEMPLKPKKPNVMMLLVGGLVGSLLAPIFLSGLADLIAGRFIEAWQVRRRLKIPVLGELTPPPPT